MDGGCEREEEGEEEREEEGEWRLKHLDLSGAVDGIDGNIVTNSAQ